MIQNVKKDQKNGTEKPAVPTVKAAPKPDAASPKQHETGKLSIEEKIQKVEELRSLTGKRQRIVDTLHQLRAFNFGADDTCMLTLADTQGNKFQTGNSNLLGILKNYLEAVLKDKLSALDDEILGFKL